MITGVLGNPRPVDCQVFFSGCDTSVDKTQRTASAVPAVLCVSECSECAGSPRDESMSHEELWNTDAVVLCQ
jgi:hypothetical protein